MRSFPIRYSCSRKGHQSEPKYKEIFGQKNGPCASAPLAHAKSRPCIGSGAGVGVLHQGGNGGGAKMTEEERGEEM